MLNRNTIVSLSRRYGSDPRWVIAGGGNTSVKDDSRLAIKASGRPLGELTADDLVEMDRPKLAAILEKDYPSDTARREAQALADLMDARAPGQGELRPSVETLMHDAFSQPLVVHTHPTAVNALTCAVDAPYVAQELFGEDLVWVDDVNPGYVLGIVVAQRVSQFREDHGREPWLMLLRNHGLVIAGETEQQIINHHDAVMETIRRALEARHPAFPREILPGAVVRDTSGHDSAGRAEERLREAFARVASNAESGAAARAATELQIVFEAAVDHPGLFDDRRDISRRLAEPFSPDHLVYALRRPLLVDPALVSGGGGGIETAGSSKPDLLAQAMSEYRAATGTLPRVVVAPGIGTFGLAESNAVARAAAALCVDALLISHGAEAFGGPRFMPAEQIEFIASWEVERFRLKQSQG